MFKTLKQIIPFIMIAFTFYSCLNEPEIAPVKVPFTTVRVANFTNSAVKLVIDGNVINNNLTANSVTNYFDLTSGSRKYVLLAANGDTIYSRPITTISYEEATVVFSGYVDPTNAKSNSVKVKSFTDGKTYLNDGVAKESGKTGIVFINTVNLTPLDSLTASAAVKVEYGDTSFTRTLAALLDKTSITVPKGIVKIIPSLTDKGAVNDTISYDFKEGKRNYVFISGDLTSVSAIVNEIVPQTARSK